MLQKRTVQGYYSFCCYYTIYAVFFPNRNVDLDVHGLQRTHKDYQAHPALKKHKDLFICVVETNPDRLRPEIKLGSSNTDIFLEVSWLEPRQQNGHKATSSDKQVT